MLSSNPKCYLVQLSSLIENYDFFQGWICLTLGHGHYSIFVNKIRTSLQMDLFSMFNCLDIRTKPLPRLSSDKMGRLKSASITRYDLFSRCHIKPSKSFISSAVLSCTITLECGRGLQRIFRVTIWYPHRSTVWGDFEISLGSGLGFKNLRAVVVPELSNGFATSKQKSNSLSWMADVPQVYLCYAERFLSFFFFPSVIYQMMLWAHAWKETHQTSDYTSQSPS